MEVQIITSDLSRVAVIMRWLLYRVTIIQRFHCTLHVLNVK